MTRRTWRGEHGSAFAVPPEVERMVAAGKLVDQSWKNEVCPRFGSPRTPRVALWVSHPDPERREFDTGRFLVSEMSDEGAEVEYTYDGDNLDAALEAFAAIEARFAS